MEISFTRYRLYRECPWKYKLFFADGRRIPPTPKSSFGLSLHRALEAWLSGGERSRESLDEALDAEWLREGYPDAETERRFRKKARRALDGFFEDEGARRSRVLGLEREFSWRLGAHTVRGMIDRIDQDPDGSVELIDYKTGPDAPPPERVAADRQLRFYALGARRGLGLSPARVTVDCVTARARVTVPADPAGDEALAADIAAAADAIEAGRFPPDVSFCPRCDFRNDCAYSNARDPRPS